MRELLDPPHYALAALLPYLLSVNHDHVPFTYDQERRRDATHFGFLDGSCASVVIDAEVRVSFRAAKHSRPNNLSSGYEHSSYL